MTDLSSTVLSRLHTKLDDLQIRLTTRLGHLAASADDLGAGSDVATRVDDMQAELDVALREHRIRIALTTAAHAIQRDGAIEGLPPLAEQMAALRKSKLFNSSWYLKANKDVQLSGQNPAEHYAKSGAFETRDPGKLFCTLDYYLANPDVAQNGWPALVHYEMHGRKEKRPSGPSD